MKTSTTEHNVANWIAHHVAQRFPDLAKNPIHGVWFTGSNVWGLLYGIPSPNADARDWDIFAIGDAAAASVARALNLASFPACRTRDKRHGAERTISASNVPRLVPHPDRAYGAYGEGYSYLTDSGEIDLWVSTPGDAFDELRTYPTASHAHCRAAFSFTGGLIVLPNELAKFGGRAA